LLSFHREDSVVEAVVLRGAEHSDMVYKVRYAILWIEKDGLGLN